MENVLLVQLPVPYPSLQTVTGNQQLGAATLMSYGRQIDVPSLPEIRLISPLRANHAGDRILVDAIVNQSPCAIGFTCTVWNIERTLYLAHSIKERAPHISIWLGGPEVSLDNPLLNTQGAPYDAAVIGEGETTFVRLASGTPPEEIRGILTPYGQTIKGRASPLLRTLDIVTDPHLEGLIPLEEDRVVFTEWTRGCPHGCIFCHYHLGRGRDIIRRSSKSIHDFLAWARRHEVHEIYLLDPSLESRPDLSVFLNDLADHNAEPTIPLMVELRIDEITESIVDELFHAGVRRVETGLQTTNSIAQRAIGRPIELPRFSRMYNALRQKGIQVKTDIMIGLPGDSPESLIDTLRFMNHEGMADHLQVFRTQVLPGTALKRRAKNLKISYDPFPPYHVLSTPTWSRQDLDAALNLVETELDTVFDLEDTPVIPEHPPSDLFKSHRLANSDLIWAWTFNIDSRDHESSIRAETFSSAANFVTLDIRTDQTIPAVSTIANALNRLVTQTPFSTIHVVLRMVPGTALDILDVCHHILARDQPSRYAHEIYRPLSSRPLPLRRIHLLVETPHRRSRLWLSDARNTARIVHCCSCGTLKDVERATKSWDGIDDDLLLVSPKEDLHQEQDRLFREIIRSSSDPSSIILPGLERALEWRSHLSRREGWDW